MVVSSSEFMPQLCQRVRLLLVLAVALQLCGCQSEEPVVKHRIHKSKSGLDDLRKSDEPEVDAPANSTLPKKRMLVGLFETEQSTWFFKVSGTLEQVVKYESDCRQFFDAVRFDGNQPKWELPEGWAKGDARPMREATLIIDSSEPKLEMAISRLASGQDLLLNANRWRQQLSLPPVTNETLESTIKEIDNDGNSYYLFDATGTGTGQMSSAPFAPFAGGGAPRRRPAPVSNEVTFDLPEGWEKGVSNSMVRVRLSKSIEKQQAVITVVRMPADINNWKDNVQRWAGQVEVTLTEDEIKSQSEAISVDGQPGQLIRLLGTDQTLGIVAALVKQGDDAWFLKISGDRDLVNDETDSFLSFCQSLKLTGNK